MTRTLNTLHPGDRGTVRTVTGDGPVVQRLGEMGLVAGATCEVIRFAPLGDPIEILLDGYHLSLRKSEAAYIEVTIL